MGFFLLDIYMYVNCYIFHDLRQKSVLDNFQQCTEHYCLTIFALTLLDISLGISKLK